MAIDDKAFAPDHKWDRNFFLIMALLAWTGVIMGFGTDMVRKFAAHKTYLPIVHFHAAAFVGWMILFTTQIWLIRSKKLVVHKTLGLVMAGLAVIMIILGPMAEIMVEASLIDTPDSDPAFMSVSFTIMLAFAGLVGTGLILRTTSSSAHKRLMLVGTIYLTSAGFARWTGRWIGSLFHQPFWGMFFALYLCINLLFLGIGVYDLITRRRLHGIYIPAILWAMANELASVWLYFDPGWLAITKALIRH